MADLRAKFKDRRELTAASLGRMKLDLIYRLPGTGTDVTGFTKPALSNAEGATDGSLHWTVVGTKLFEAYEKAMADEEFLKKCVVEGKAPITEVMAKEITSALSARVTGDLKPQFDYAAEVKTAKDNRREMLDKLHLLGPPVKTDSAEPAKTGSVEPAKTQSAATEKPAATPSSKASAGEPGAIRIRLVAAGKDNAEFAITLSGKNLGADVAAMKAQLEQMLKQGVAQNTTVKIEHSPDCQSRHVVAVFDAVIEAGFMKIEFPPPA